MWDGGLVDWSDEVSVGGDGCWQPRELETRVLGNRLLAKCSQKDLSPEDVNVGTGLAAFSGWQLLLKLRVKRPTGICGHSCHHSETTNFIFPIFRLLQLFRNILSISLSSEKTDFKAKLEFLNDTCRMFRDVGQEWIWNGQEILCWPP